MAPPADAIIRMEPCSSGAEPDDVMFHDCSTLGGVSGSCVVDLDSNQVIGLHFGNVCACSTTRWRCGGSWTTRS